MVKRKDASGRTIAALYCFMIKDIKNSSGKKIGIVDFTSECIRVCHWKKPELIIDDPVIVQAIFAGDLSVVTTLYDDYTMLVSELAALYNTKYHIMAKHILSLPVRTAKKQGRRNSSYGTTFSESRLKHMSESQKGHPGHLNYDMTPEMKARISRTLKEGYESGRIEVNGTAISQAWADGKYKNAKMGRGIQGYFYSHKTECNHYFRSLLELKYLIQIEEDPSIITYDTEPVCIKLPHSAHYTPDMILNNAVFVELKPHNFDKYTDIHRFCLEMSGLNDYCNKNNLGFVVVYDTDIDFESRRYRNYLRSHPEVIEKYNIEFKKAI